MGQESGLGGEFGRGADFDDAVGPGPVGGGDGVGPVFDVAVFVGGEFFEGALVLFVAGGLAAGVRGRGQFEHGDLGFALRDPLEGDGAAGALLGGLTGWAFGMKSEGVVATSSRNGRDEGAAAVGRFVLAIGTGDTTFGDVGVDLLAGDGGFVGG